MSNKNAMREHFKNEPPYFVRRVRWGFGFQVCDHKEFKTHYSSPDEKQVKKACDMLNAGKSLADLPAPSDKWPNRLVIFKEKHGDRHFLVKTMQDLGEVALKIFNERLKEKFWYDFSELTDNKEVPLTEDQINALPNEKLKKAARENNASLIGDTRYNKELERQKKMYDVIIEKKDSEVALKFLDSRQKYEYEAFEVEQFENEKY